MSKFIDLTGKKYNMLTVIKRLENTKEGVTRWLCKCDCGNTTVVRGIIFVTCSSWLIYNYCVFSIAGVLCEAFTLISLIIGVIRLDVIPHLTKNK